MKEIKDILHKALFKLDKIELDKEFTLFDSHIKNGSTYHLYIDNESYNFFISYMKYDLKEYKIFANEMNGLHGWCNIALLAKDNLEEIKLDKVMYKIIIE